MSNNNTIIDPITGKEIDNTGINKVHDPITQGLNSNSLLQQETSNFGSFSGQENVSQREANSFPTLNAYDTPEEEYEQRAISQTSYDQVLNGLGKAVVTFGGALAENTLGIPFGVVSALSGKGYQNNIIGESVDALNAMAQEAMPNYQTKSEQESIMGSISNPGNFFFDKVLNGAAYSAAGMVSMMIPGGISKLPSMIARGVGKLALKQGARAVAKNAVTFSRNAGKAAEFGIKGFSGALAESSVEARETQKELRTNLTESLINKKQEEALASGNYKLDDNGKPIVNITQKEYDEIEKLSLEGSSANFKLNMLMVGGTQMLTFGNLMRGASKEGYKNLAKKIIKKDGEYIKKILTNKQKLKKGALLLAGDSAGEAAQEGGQFASNIAINDFYLKSFQNPLNANLYESVSKALEETINSKEGRESMLIGAIVGGGMTAMSKAGESFQEKQLKKKGKLSNEDKAIQKILDIKNSKSIQTIQDSVKNNNRILEYNNDLQKAIMENDEAGIQKASFNLLKADLYSHLAQGTEEVYLEKLQELKELDEKSFKEYFNMQDIQDPINVEEFANDMLSKTEEAIKIYKNIDFLYDTNASGIQKLAQNLDQDELKVREYLKSNLYSALTDHDYMINREDELGQRLEEKTNGLVTYLKNKENGGYIKATTEQAQNLLDNEQSKEFKEKLKKDWKKIKGLKEALKSYPGTFKNVDEFVDHLIESNNKFAKKQDGFINTIEAIKNSSLNPILQKELQNSINELRELALKRELNDALIQNLEGELKGNNNPEFAAEIKSTIDSLNKQIKDFIIEQAKKEAAEKDDATVKAESTEDSDTADEVSKIKKKKTDDINNLSYNLDLSDFSKSVSKAETYQELDAIIDQADKAGLMTRGLMEQIGKRRRKIDLAKGPLKTTIEPKRDLSKTSEDSILEFLIDIENKLKSSKISINTLNEVLKELEIALSANLKLTSEDIDKIISKIYNNQKKLQVNSKNRRNQAELNETEFRNNLKNLLSTSNDLTTHIKQLTENLKFQIEFKNRLEKQLNYYNQLLKEGKLNKKDINKNINKTKKHLSTINKLIDKIISLISKLKYTLKQLVNSKTLDNILSNIESLKNSKSIKDANKILKSYEDHLELNENELNEREVELNNLLNTSKRLQVKLDFLEELNLYINENTPLANTNALTIIKKENNNKNNSKKTPSTPPEEKSNKKIEEEKEAKEEKESKSSEKKLENVIPYMQKRYSSEDGGAALWKKEKEEILSILNDSQTIDIEDFDENDIDILIGSLDLLIDDIETLEKLASFYKKNDASKTKPQAPIIEIDQPLPSEVDSKIIRDTHSDPNDETIKGSLNLQDNEVVMAAPTLGNRKGTDYPDVYDNNISKLNNPNIGVKGTKVYLEYRNDEYNQNNKNPRLFAYILDEEDNKFHIGLVTKGYKNNPSVLGKQIFEQIKPSQIGDLAIDLNLEIERKNYSKFNKKEDQMVNPMEIDKVPKLAIALEDSGTVILHNRDIKITADVKPSKLKVGHVYMYVATPQTNSKGEIIYYAAELKTQRVFELDPSYGENVVDLLLKDTEKDGKKSNNFDKVNDQIFLNYEIKNDKIIIYDFKDKENTTKILTIDKNNVGDVNKLKSFINKAVVKVDIKKINNPAYNKKIANEGRIKIDLDPVVPIYDTHFIVKQNKPKTEEEDDSNLISWNDFMGETESTQPTIKTDDVNNDVSDSANKQTPLSSKVNTNEDLGFLPKLKTKSNTSKSNATKKENETELEYVQRMIPNTPLKTQVDLARIAKQGSNAAGMFLNGVIYLEKNFQRGVAFHEAFHAVFNSYFTEKERSELYTLAQAEYGTFNYSEKNKLSELYPDLNNSELEDIWLEEQLAEEFEKYMIGVQDKSLSQKIKDFFKRLLNAIRGVSNNKSIMNEVFRNISNGKYGKRPINYRFNNVPMLSQRLQGFNSYESLEAVELVHQTFNHLLKTKTKKILDKENVELSEVEAITIFNQNNKLYHEVYAIMENEFKNIENGPKKEFLRKLMLNFYGDTNDVMGDLIKNHKLYYKIYNYVEISDRVLAINEELDIKDTLEELDEIPDFLMPVIEKNSKDKLSQKVKKVLFNLQTDKPNILNYPKLTNFDSLDNTLQEKLSGMMHANEMYARLEEESVFHFELKSLINQLKEDPSLQAQFFSHYSMGQDKVLQIVNEESTTKIDGKKTKILKNQLIDTSSKQIRKEILTDWESNLVASNLFDSDGKINLENAIKYFKLYRNEVENIKSKLILTENDLVQLSNILINLYQLPLSSKDLFNKFNSYDTKLQFDKFLSNESQMLGILKAFSKNKNIFISPSPSDNLGLDEIIKSIRDTRKEYFQSSILNGEGKQEYTYRVPAYIHKAVSLFNSKNGTKYVDKIYGNDKSFDNSLLLDQVRLGKNINVRKIDSIQLQDETTGTRFKNYNALKYQTVNLQSYINQEEGDTKKSNKAYYQMAITSDAPVNYFIENDKFNISESLDNLYNIYLFEKNRMDTISDIKNYNSEEFILLPFMNDVKNLEDLKPSEIIEIIDENMKKYYDIYRDGLIKSGFAYEINGELKSDYISDTYTKSAKYNSLEEITKEYYYASFFMIAESTTVFAGDPSFAKPDKKGSKITDMNKRLREITSPAQMLDITAMGINGDKNNKAQSNSKYTVLIVEDEKKNIISNELYKVISKRFPKVDNPTTQEEINNNIRLELLSKEIENSDGQSIITMERFKNIKLGQGLWSNKLDEAYNNIKQGTASFSDENLFMNPIKGFHFELIKDASGKVVPIQKKDSEIVLLPSMVKNNPNLQKIQDRLYDKENPVDMISFESAIKKGVHNKNSLNDLYMNNPITLNYSFYGIQQPSPEKHLNSKITFGTQFRKIIIGNLSGIYNLNNGTSAEEIKKIYETFIIDNIKEDSIKVIKEMGYDYETGKIDYKKLEKLLVRELDNNNFGPEFKEYLELNDKGDGFKLELWNPIHSHRIESLLQSYVKNKVTKQKIKGGTFINASNLMVTGNKTIKPSIQGKDDLQVVMGKDKNGNVLTGDKAYIEHFEVVLPAWSKDIMEQYMNEDGSIKNEMPQELRELVGYRIPTESKYSMTKIYVKSFTPQSMGSTIFMPTEVIALAGLDFDIDKMFFMIPEHKTTYNKSTWSTAYDYIESNNIGRQTMISELLDITEDEFVDDNYSIFNKVEFKDLKNIYIENILFSNFNIQNNNKTKYNNQYDNKKIESIEYIVPNYDDLSKNNKKQRNNGIIEISKSILSAPQTLNEQTNPGSFINLIKHRDKLIKITGNTKILNSFAAPDVQQELFERTRDASALIGVFANNVASNNMLQYENLTLEKPFGFLGDTIYVLDEKDNLEITRSLSTLVAAAVDAVKDPVFKDLNITKFTGNVLTTMIRLGVNELDAIKVLNNRKVIELAEEVGKLKFQKPSEINDLINTLKNDLDNIGILNTKSQLNNSVNKDKTNKTLDDLALNTFKKFYDLSQDVKKLTRATKIDANPPGTIMADNEVTIRNVKEIKEGLKSFEDTSKIFNTNKTNYPLINEFFKATYLEPTNKVFNTLFPWYKSNFDDAKTNILYHLSEKDLSSKQINNINYALLTYFASEENNLLLTFKERQRLQTEFWDQLKKFKNKNKNKYLILDMLNYDTKEKVIKFKNTTKVSSYKMTELKNSWYDLYIDLKNTENENLAVDLFKYNFMINGFNYNSKSFTHLAPKMMFTDVLKIDRINELIKNGEVSAFVNSYIMNEYKILSLPQLTKSDPGIDRNNYKVDTNKKVYYFKGNKYLPGVEKFREYTYFPKFIKSEDNNILYLRRGPEEKLGKNPEVEYFAVRKLGGKFSTEFMLNSDNFMTSVADNWYYRGDRLIDGKLDTRPIASANIEQLYADIIQDNNIQYNTATNLKNNNNNVFEPTTTLEKLTNMQQQELDEILIDKEISDNKNNSIDVIINSVIDELKTAEYLTSKQIEYYIKQLENNPTKEGYIKFRKEFCK